MAAIDLQGLIPSLTDPQHKTYLGNASFYVGRLDGSLPAKGVSVSSDVVTVPLITLSHGALIDSVELKFSAFGTGAKAKLGFRYVNYPSASSNPNYGSAAWGLPTQAIDYFIGETDVSSAGSVGPTLLTAQFLAQQDVQIILTVYGSSGTNIIPASATAVVRLSGRAKGGL